MSLLWHFYWPAIAVGLVIGFLAGRFGFLRSEPPEGEPAPRTTDKRRRRRLFGLGFLATIVAAGLWHGPIGAGNRFAASVEANTRAELNRLEMASVQARIQRRPLYRTLLLSGPADDFQRSELVRIMGSRPGVGGARWVNPVQGNRAWLPLIVDAMLLGLIGFLPGLLLSYLLELRRRSNAQWSW